MLTVYHSGVPKFQDVIIVGAGPAGLTAGLYCARANLRTLVLRDREGSNLARVPHITNLFGFASGVSGPALLRLGERHAAKYGADVRTEEVLKCLECSLLPVRDPGRKRYPKAKFLVHTDSEVYGARTLIVAAGIQIRSGGIEREFEMFGKGVAVCVACDGPFYKRKKVVVVGGGNLAASEALDLLAHTKDVRVNPNGDRATMSAAWRRKLDRAGVAVINKKIARVVGTRWMTDIEYVDGTREPMAGLFLAIGTASAVDFARSLGLEMIGQSIGVERRMRTNLAGVWAAGDVTGPPRQVGKSVGDGVRAAIDCIEYLRGGIYVDHRED